MVQGRAGKAQKDISPSNRNQKYQNEGGRTARRDDGATHHTEADGRPVGRHKRRGSKPLGPEDLRVQQQQQRSWFAFVELHYFPGRDTWLTRGAEGGGLFGRVKLGPSWGEMIGLVLLILHFSGFPRWDLKSRNCWTATCVFLHTSIHKEA